MFFANGQLREAMLISKEYWLFGGLGQRGTVDFFLTANDVAISRRLDHHIRTTVYELSNFALRYRGMILFIHISRPLSTFRRATRVFWSVARFSSHFL